MTWCCTCLQVLSSRSSITCKRESRDAASSSPVFKVKHNVREGITWCCVFKSCLQLLAQLLAEEDLLLQPAIWPGHVASGSFQTVRIMLMAVQSWPLIYWDCTQWTFSCFGLRGIPYYWFPPIAFKRGLIPLHCLKADTWHTFSAFYNWSFFLISS